MATRVTGLFAVKGRVNAKREKYVVTSKETY